MILSSPFQVTSEQVKEALASARVPMVTHHSEDVLPYEQWLNCEYARGIKRESKTNNNYHPQLLRGYERLFIYRDSWINSFGLADWKTNKHRFGMLR